MVSAVPSRLQRLGPDVQQRQPLRNRSSNRRHLFGNHRCLQGRVQEHCGLQLGSMQAAANCTLDLPAQKIWAVKSPTPMAGSFWPQVSKSARKRCRVRWKCAMGTF